MKPGARPPYTTAKPASNLQRPEPLPTNGMRNFLIVVWLLIGAFAAYAYTQNPAGCMKVVADSREVISSLLPNQNGGSKTAPIVGASIGTTADSKPSPPAAPAPAVVVSAPPHVVLPASPATRPPDSTTAPPGPRPKVDIFPAEPNWVWTTIDGKTYKDVVITKIEANVISITHSTGVSHLPMSLLSDDVKKQLHYDPAAAAAAAAADVPTSAVSKMITGKLVDASGASVKPPGDNVEFYAVYYSAAWCPPCHFFTPKLVAWYNKFKAVHPNFEVIFVSDDRSPPEMLAYMKEMSMPWLAINFSDLTHTRAGIEQYAGTGIPDLVLIDKNGKVLADSFQGETYLGPSQVIDQINKLVGGSSPVPL